MEEVIPSVFSYINFRDYLKDYVDVRKKMDKHFSHRRFAQLVGIPLSNSSLLSALISGRKNLSQTYLLSICKVLELSPRQTEYFELLVGFTQSKNLEEKNHIFQKISRFRNSRAQQMAQESYGIFDKWYITAVWHWVGLRKKERITKKDFLHFSPKINQNEFEEALAQLMDIGLIRKTANGYLLTGKHLKTESEVEDISLMRYYEEMNDIARRALLEVEAERRCFKALTFSVSGDGYQKIVERSISFFEEIREILDRDQKEDRVCALNLQLFPMTK